MKTYLNFLAAVLVGSAVVQAQIWSATTNPNSVQDPYSCNTEASNLSFMTSVELQKGYLPMLEPSRRMVKEEEYWFHRAMNSQDAVSYDDTKMLKALVADAAALIRQKGELAFPDFRVQGSRWRQGETYIFVLDLNGHMLVHADASMENTLQIDLKDIHGKPIIKGLISAVTSIADKTEGWYHYQWPVPGGLLPRWKSSYVQLVKAPSGKSYVVGSGMYNDRMEREFVVSAVHDAVGQIEKNKEEAFRLFRDPTSPFIAKDAYIFVIDEKGTDLVNPGFPILEGRNLMDLKDSQGKLIIRDMFDVVQNFGSGWVDYMWPKPGESISTQKSTYVSRAKVGDQFFMVGCGVYLADAPKVLLSKKKMNANELMNLVREAAKEFERRGEKAYPDFRKKESKWFHDDSYFFVWSLDGRRIFHAANPAGEGLDMSKEKDVLQRPFGQMILQAGSSASGEGWVHYMYPEPGNIFPIWKSTFVKRVRFPSGKEHYIGCGIYNMQMNKAFIEDVVMRASILVAARGKEAFPALRDKTGPFLFMDTYVFVDSPEGVELVNPAQPSIEGVNIKDFKDARGKYLARQYIDAAMKQGSAWVEYYWYKPGDNIPVKKYTFVRQVKHGTETYIVGAGLYVEEENDDDMKVE